MANKLTGRRFLADLGVFKSELFFESDEILEFKIVEGGGPGEPEHTERVKVTIAEVRPEVYMVCWKEATGATVTHVEDHQNGILFSNATLADGSFYPMKGTITAL